MLGIVLTVVAVAACSGQTSEDTDKAMSEDPGANSSSEYPVVIEHAFGVTELQSKPSRIATIAWSNQDVPLALGVVPVGFSEANYGVTDDSGLLPWTAARLRELGETDPVVFRDSTGLDYEAISDVRPDVILAAYSGLTEEEYTLLSRIAPVVAYPDRPWQTYWREQTILNATGMGMKAEGQELVAELEQMIATKTARHPELEGKTAGFFYFIPTDFSQYYIYLPRDPRAAYLQDLGLVHAPSITRYAEEYDDFAVTLSAENADELRDIDIIIAYGDEALLRELQDDSLLSSIPAIERGSVVFLEDNSPLAAAVNPSALSMPAVIDEYLTLLSQAAEKVQ